MEMKMTKQYKVLKECVIFNGNHYNVGDNFEVNPGDNIHSAWVEYGFIEPYTPEPKHWRAGFNEEFFYLDEFCEVCALKDPYDNCHYDLGNYFKSQVTAELVAKARKLLFELLHDTEIKYMKYTELERAIKEARKAVLEDYSNE